ncbi:MAG: hypothetical protein H6855_01535 [Rhodospirillales bacterium]|nr:hypothetical protein [Rhodospirillales bacterium]MCB9973752.1 hypothetical protein [Rhodospirillales bacterium]MCB9980668.1 hypothetical protein [Rhodospirillales bacterium]
MTNVLDTSLNHERVSDRILYALELALEQKDVDVSETLTLALEKAMTRNAGGGMFVERRDYPERIQTALDRLKSLKS